MDACAPPDLNRATENGPGRDISSVICRMAEWISFVGNQMRRHFNLRHDLPLSHFQQEKPSAKRLVRKV